jgi:hypothetical protein
MTKRTREPDARERSDMPEPKARNPFADIVPGAALDLDQARQELAGIINRELESEIISAEVLSFRMKTASRGCF